MVFWCQCISDGESYQTADLARSTAPGSLGLLLDGVEHGACKLPLMAEFILKCIKRDHDGIVELDICRRD